MELLSAINGSSFYAEYAASALKDSEGNDISSTYVHHSATLCSIGDSNSCEEIPSNSNSFAQGYGNTADYFSMAQGTRNSASEESFAQGRMNSADTLSIAQGYDNWAYDGAQAFGVFLKISGGMAIGCANETTAARFVIGNGDREGITRETVNKSDLFVIDENGNVSSLSGYFYDKDGKVGGGGGSIPDDVAVSSLSAATGLSASGINIISAISSISSTYAEKTELNDYQPTSSMTSYYTTAEVDDIVSRIGTFEIVSLTTATPIVPDVQDPNTKTVYLTKATTATVTDPYKEWIFTSADPSTTAWECIGDMSVDLSNYYTKSQSDGKYCTDSNAKIYSNFAGGNGITVAGELTQTKTINSNLTEYQLQEGVGITYDVDDTNEIIKFHAKPEIFLYYTTAPIMATSTAIAFSTNSAAYNSKSGTVGINNSEITGLDSTKLYHCNVKMIVENGDSTPATVSVKASNWNNNDSITYEYVNSSNSGTMVLDWYIKGLTGCALTGGGLTTTIQAGVKEIMITEVCYA